MRKPQKQIRLTEGEARAALWLVGQAVVVQVTRHSIDNNLVNVLKKLNGVVVRFHKIQRKGE